MRSSQANALEGGAGLGDQTMPIRQWVVVFAGILAVAVPWWLGLFWIIGPLR